MPQQQNEIDRTIAGPPSGYFVVLPTPDKEARVDLADLARSIIGSWKLIAVVMILSGIAAVIIVLRMHNVYRSQVILAPVNQGPAGAASSLSGQMGGLASLVGVNLTSGGEKEQAIAMIGAPGLAREFINTEHLLPILFADRWDSTKQQWIPGKLEPTLEDGVRLFTSDVRTVSEDRRTGIITIRFEWYDPDLAASWANKYVEMANERLRAQAIASADASLKYLNQEFAKTDVVSIRQAISKLMENQVNNAMVANVQRDYAFRVIDRAVPSDLKSKISPQRTLIVVGSVLTSGFLVVLWVLFVKRTTWRKQAV